MKKYTILLSALLLTIVIGCKKYNNPPSYPSTYPPGNPTNHPPSDTGLDDVRTVLLKDVLAERLPSPYYHFTYDDQHYVTQISYASGLSVYNVEYENKRVKRMANIKNDNTFLYSYSNKQVSEITEFSQAGTKRASYQFSYNDSKQLTQVLWHAFTTGNNDSLYKKQVITWDTDGNIAAIDHYYSTPSGQLKLGKRDEFSVYGDETNVDDFYLLEDFFDSFLFLPQVKFQKTNPHKQRIFTDSADYDISYRYDYFNSLPIRRTGMMLATRGAQQGQTIQILNTYNYY